MRKEITFWRCTGCGLLCGPIRMANGEVPAHCVCFQNERLHDDSEKPHTPVWRELRPCDGCPRSEACAADSSGCALLHIVAG